MKTFFFFLSFFVMLHSMEAQKQITILHTNNINAQLENCLCHKHPYGGLEKIGWQVPNIRKQNKLTYFFLKLSVFYYFLLIVRKIKQFGNW